MLNKDNEELVENLMTRNIDDSNYGSSKKIIIIIIVLILAIILVVALKHKSSESKNEETKVKYEVCKYDDCKTFSKDFINNVRYTGLINDAQYYNCGDSKESIDSILDYCAELGGESCGSFDSNKQYCYKFTSDNVSKEVTLELVNPKSVNEVQHFINLKNLYIDITDNNYDILSVINSINELELNFTTTIYLKNISLVKDYNLEELNVNNSKNINICVGSKAECNKTNMYLNQEDFINVLKTFKTLKTDLYSLNSKPTDLEKIAYIYSYIVKNVSPSSNVISDVEQINKDNFDKLITPRTLKGAVLNKEASYYGYIYYLDELAKYLGLESKIVNASILSNNYEYGWNQIKINGKWYNVDVTLDAINYHNKDDGYTYFLLSDDEFNHKDNYQYSNDTIKVNESFNKDKINEVLKSYK